MGWKAPKFIRKATNYVVEPFKNPQMFTQGLQVLQNKGPVGQAAAGASAGLVSLVPAPFAQPARDAVQTAARTAQQASNPITKAVGYASGFITPSSTGGAALNLGLSAIPAAGPIARAAASRTGVSIADDIGRAAVRGIDDFGRASVKPLSRVGSGVDNVVPVISRLAPAARSLTPFVTAGTIAGIGTGLGAGLASNSLSGDAYNRGATATASQLGPVIDEAGNIIDGQNTAIQDMNAYIASLESALAQAGTTGFGAVGAAIPSDGGFMEDLFGEASAPFFGEGDTLFERFQSMPPAGKALVVGGGLALALGGAKAFGLTAAAKSSAASASTTPRRSKK